MKKLFVIGMAALLLVAFSMPAMAKVKLGGIVFTDFYYIDRDLDNMGGTDSYQNTRLELPIITRLYARWTNEDNVGMYIELGLGKGGKGIGAHDGNGDVPYLRHAYGWWDVSPAIQILAGHTTTPFSPLNPSQLLGTNSGSLNIIGVGYGDFYSGRFPQVRGTFRFGKMGRFEVALVTPNDGQAENAGGPAAGQLNTKLPRIDIGVPLYFGPVSIYPGFLYQHQSFDNLPPGQEDNLDTIIGSLGAKAGFGPFGIAAEFNYGQNWANTRSLIGVGTFNNNAVNLAGAQLDKNGRVEDAETYSFWIDVSYKFGPITPHVMYGSMKSKIDNLAVGSAKESKTQMYGISVPIDLAKGFRVRPELMWYDNGDTKLEGGGSFENGKYAIYGVQFQITF